MPVIVVLCIIMNICTAFNISLIHKVLLSIYMDYSGTMDLAAYLPNSLCVEIEIVGHVCTRSLCGL